MNATGCLFLLPVLFLLVNSQSGSVFPFCVSRSNNSEVIPSMQLPPEGVQLFLQVADQPIPSYLMLRYDQISPEMPLWCQSDNHSLFHNGKWNQPPGVIPPNYTEIQSTFSVMQPYQAVSCVGEVALLRHSDNVTGHEGILLCTISDTSNVQHSLYVGVYNGEFYDNYAGPVVSPMQFVLTSPRDASIPAFNLSFVSSNGPPTMVTCALDGANLNSSLYSVSRVVTSPHSNGATPDKTNVTISMMTNQGGEYACTVTVMGRNSTQSIQLGSNTTRLNIIAPSLSIIATRVMPSMIIVIWVDVREFNSYEVFYRIINGNQHRMNASQTPVQLTSLPVNEGYEIFVVGFGVNNTLPSRSNAVTVPAAASIEILNSGSDQRLSQNFVLECVVTALMNLSNIRIMWKNPNNETIDFVAIDSLASGSNTSFVLEFGLLGPLNDGVYTCEANISLVTSFEVASRPVVFTLERENSNTGIIVGDNSSITCSAGLPESFNLPVSFSWVKDNVTVQKNQTIMIDNPLQNTSIIEFRPVTTSSGGVYECVLRVNGSINIMLGQINFTVTTNLFCDPENTTTEQFGSYSWPETAVEDTAQLPCVFRPGYNASRTCTQGGSWVAVDVSNCRIISPASVNFTVYLRFTSTLDRILLGGSISGALQTIENVVLEMVNITAIKCNNVLSIGGGNDRVECTVEGSTDSQNQLRNASLSQIIVVLGSNNFTISGTEVFSDIGFCNENITTTQTSGTFQWNETEVNNTASSRCFYGPTDEMATRQCVSRLTWAPPSLDQCRTVISEQFNDIQQMNVSTENIVQLVRNVSNLTAAAQSADQNSDNAEVIATVLTEAASVLQNISLNEVEEVTENAVNILDNIEEWPMERIEDQSNMIVQSFEKIVDALIGQNNFTSTSIVSEDIALRAETIKRDQFFGRTLTVRMNETLQITNNDIDGLPPNLDSVLSIPEGVRSAVHNNEDVRIAFTVYDSTALFPVRNTSQNLSADDTVVGSQIVSGLVSEISGILLNPPVTYSLRLINYNLLPNEYVTSRRCVFWDFNAANGQGDWSTDGCNMTEYNQTTDVVGCECNHLTNFACLVDISIRVNQNATALPHEYVLALEIVTYVGVFFSLVGLILLILTHLIFKNIRQKDVTKFHVQLALSMILMLIVFVAGIDRTENRAGCITVGVLLHYLILVTWMWMAAEAVLLFQKLVIVFKKITTLYMTIVSIICWACPLLPVVISVSINPDNYIHNMQPNITRGFCFISDLGVFLGAFLGPILLVIIFNVGVFICSTFIIIKHMVRKSESKAKTGNKQNGQKKLMPGNKACKLFLSLTGIMFLLGLSWMVLLFTFVGINHSIEAAFTIQLLFVFFNSFQGFFLFFLIVAINQDSRNQWTVLLCPWTKKKKSASTTSRYRKYTSSTGLTKDTSSSGQNTLEKKDNARELTNTSSEGVNTDFIDKTTDTNNDDSTIFGREPQNMRKLRRSTIRRTHHIETVEMDFFDDGNTLI